MIIKRTFSRPSVDVKWLNMDDATYAAFATAISGISGVTISSSVSADGLTRIQETTIADASHDAFMVCLNSNRAVIDAEAARRTSVGITFTQEIV